jgi:hypothetical protein
MAGKSKIARINGESLIVQEEQILKFQREIERIVVLDECTYLEAISSYCEDNDVDYESAKNLISVPLMEKLKHEVYKAKLVNIDLGNTLFGV